MEIAPLVASLNVLGALRGTGGITLNGGGVLQLGTLDAYSGTTNVNAGSTLQFGASNVGSPTSAVVLNGGSSKLNVNGFSSAIGSLAGAGIVTNSTFSQGSLTFGYDNTNMNFSGAFVRLNDATGATSYVNSLNIVKVGTGALNFTGSGSSLGALFVNAGSMVYSGTATTSFLANTINAGASVILDNTTTNVSGRLGQGAVPSALLPLTLTLGGGSLTVLGNASSPTIEALGGVRTLVSSGATTASTSLTVNSTA
jgi:hypothetical protein